MGIAWVKEFILWGYCGIIVLLGTYSLKGNVSNGLKWYRGEGYGDMSLPPIFFAKKCDTAGKKIFFEVAYIF